MTLHADASALLAATIPIECRHCPAELHMIADPRTDLWEWVGPDGSKIGDCPDLPPDPWGHLNRLGERMAASKYRDNAAACEYVMLKVRLDLGGTWHQHYPRPDREPAYDGPVPEHCGWPGWLRPSGWWCRQCKIALDQASANERT